MKESLFQKLRMVRLADMGHVFLFLFALLPAAVYKRRRSHMWLICESAGEARDNGYWLFQYLRGNQPQIDAVYAIKRASAERVRVESLGPTVPYGSFRHWIFYLAAEVNISSQKNGKPNAAVCYMLEVVLEVLKNRRVFVQHGVVINDLPFLHEDRAKLSLFCCGALPEYEFVKNVFGYPENAVQYLGLCRFDGLHGCNTDKDIILILPTWRMWLHRQQGAEAKDVFCASEYYRSWSGLLNGDAVVDLLERYHKRAVFCLHRNMQAFESLFYTDNPHITLLRWEEADIETLIRKAGVLITDYSSVSMDFAYMDKPVLYYQFDQSDFRRHHLPEGYFDYKRDGFGPVCEDMPSLLAGLEHVCQNQCFMQSAYRQRAENFFKLRDANNCERTFEAIERLLCCE